MLLVIYFILKLIAFINLGVRGTALDFNSAKCKIIDLGTKTRSFAIYWGVMLKTTEVEKDLTV